jgi:PAS domain S-box-containing protein
MPASEARRVAEIFGPVFERREAFHGLEIVNRSKDGRPVVVETSGTPFFGPDGNFRGYRGVDRDIGERKRIEELLRISEERFRQLFEQNEEPQILFRKGTCEIIDANGAAVKLHGHSREELLRNGLNLFVPPEDLPWLSSAISGIQPSAGLIVERATQVRKDGTRIVVSARGHSIQLKEGEVAFCSFRDITARIRMEEEAKVHQAQLIHANRMASLGTIVSGVAHEVNNPNNLIMFNTPMILSAWHDAVPVLEAYFRENGDFSLGGLTYSEMRDVVPRLARGISDASLRIKKIVGDLKDFARQDRSKGHEPVRINDVVRAALGILNHEIIKGTRRFEAQYGEALPAVMGSPRELEQVIINLVNNALQALPSTCHGIAVKTSRNSGTGEVEIHVVDEGVGIAPELMSRISEPFFSTRLDNDGLGLGLSICRSIVKDHRGSLSFESEVGKGTRAIVRLPPIVDAMNSAATYAPAPKIPLEEVSR